MVLDGERNVTNPSLLREFFYISLLDTLNYARKQVFLLSSSYAKSRRVHTAIKSAFINLMPFSGDTSSLSDITVLVTLDPHVNYLLNQPVTKVT